MKNSKFRMKLSFSERGHFVLSKVQPTYYNHMIIEGDTNSDIGIDALTAAIKISSESNHGSRLVLRGLLNFSYLEDSGVPPPLRIVENVYWDGLSSDKADFFDASLNARSGPTCEVIYLKGDPNRIIFRTHHMVMDGIGTMLWAEDVFRVLRGEKPVSFFAELTEYDLIKRMGEKPRVQFPQNNIAPTGKSDGIVSFKPRWIRRSVTGRYSNLIGQISVLLAAEARKYSEGNFYVSIPVDLRQRNNYFKTTRNFVGIIYVEVKPDNSVSDISTNIRRQLENAEDLNFDIEDVYCRYIPVSIMKKSLTKRVLKRHSRSRYGSSATISNLGYVDIGKFTGGGFNAETFFIVTALEYSPAFIILSGSKNLVEITLSVPDVLRTNNRDEKLMDAIVSGLVPRG